jgi:acetyl esterase/lipase
MKFWIPLLSACCAGVGQLLAAEPAAVRVVTEVEFLEPGRTQRLDLYLPANASPARPVPALVWVHGGGWTTGDRARAREKNIGTTLAGWGIAVASISYQLGPGAWPRNLHDVKNAVRFLRARGADYGIDGRRIALGGGSAGGHLALLAAFTADREFEPSTPYPGVSNAVRTVVDFYGPTNHLTRRKADAAGNSTNEPHLGNAETVFGADRAILAATSPVTHVRRDVPPVFIAHGTADATVPADQSRELAAALAAAGATHELVLLPGIGHTFDLEKWEGKPMPESLSLALKAFLERTLVNPSVLAGSSARE